MSTDLEVAVTNNDSSINLDDFFSRTVGDLLVLDFKSLATIEAAI